MNSSRIRIAKTIKFKNMFQVFELISPTFVIVNLYGFADVELKSIKKLFFVSILKNGKFLN